jgi:hypothetical protein
LGVTLFLDAVSQYLRSDLSPAPALLGGTEPGGPKELPAVTLSLPSVATAHPGIGATPRAEVTGALQVSASIDLAAPYLDVAGERVQLLTGGRTRLQLPHGTIVRADGTSQMPFAKADLAVSLTPSGGSKQTYTVISRAPTLATEVQPEPLSGTLRFGTALPTSGRVDATYWIGTWELRAQRFSGELRIDAFASDGPATDELSRRLEASLAPDRSRRIQGLHSLVPTAWGPVSRFDPSSLRRSLTYRFEYEREDPVIPTSGGPIGRVSVTASTDAAGSTTRFDVTRKA